MRTIRAFVEETNKRGGSTSLVEFSEQDGGQANQVFSILYEGIYRIEYTCRNGVWMVRMGHSDHPIAQQDPLMPSEASSWGLPLQRRPAPRSGVARVATVRAHERLVERLDALNRSMR